jgi:hypothetical protein
MLSREQSRWWVVPQKPQDFATFRIRPFIIGYNPGACAFFDTLFDCHGRPAYRSNNSSVTMKGQRRSRTLTDHHAWLEKEESERGNRERPQQRRHALVENG